MRQAEILLCIVGLCYGGRVKREASEDYSRLGRGGVGTVLSKHFTLRACLHKWILGPKNLHQKCVIHYKFNATKSGGFATNSILKRLKNRCETPGNSVKHKETG